MGKKITMKNLQEKLVCDCIGFDGIITHSFRKWYGAGIYKNNGFDIAPSSGFCSIAAPWSRNGILE